MMAGPRPGAIYSPQVGGHAAIAGEATAEVVGGLGRPAQAGRQESSQRAVGESRTRSHPVFEQQCQPIARQGR